MRWLFTALLILLAAVSIGLLAHRDPGYVLFGRGYTTVEMSLSLFVTLQIVLFALLYLLIRVAMQTWRMPRDVHNWRQRRRTRRARAASRRGLIELSEGHWRTAELALIKHVRHSETPLLNYLSAARAAQKQNAHQRRDHYLSMAAHSMPDADIAVELTQAELQLAHGQLEQSLATLEHLRSIVPQHSHVLLLLSQLYEKLQNWQDLKSLLPLLRKHKVLEPDALHKLSLCTYDALLVQVVKQQDKDKLQQFWRAVPKDLRNEPGLITHYARLSIALEDNDTAEAFLRGAIKQQWRAEWIELYGQIKSSEPTKQLATAESWLKGRENNPHLLLCLGRICIQNQLWGKARAYLEASLSNQPRSETYRELGQLLEQLQEPEAATDCYRQGLLLASESRQMIALVPETS